MQSEAVASAYRIWRRNWKGKGKEYSAGVLVWQVRIQIESYESMSKLTNLPSSSTTVGPSPRGLLSTTSSGLSLLFTPSSESLDL